MKKSLRLGLTGGIGSGKSTVAQFLSESGAAIFDADAISRTLTQPGGRAMPALLAEFGENMVNSDGAMNRDAMRALVFSDPLSKQRLEAIIHPLIGQVMQEQTQAALEEGKTLLVYDVPLLVEAGDRWRKQLDLVCVIDCSPETQMSRVLARSAMSQSEVERIIYHQVSRSQRLACADLVITNEGITLAQLKQQVNDMLASFGL
jgi:dephospho-CoA kinase